jgi:hypothetical protein
MGTRPGDLESPGSCCELAPRSLLKLLGKLLGACKMHLGKLPIAKPLSRLKLKLPHAGNGKGNGNNQNAVSSPLSDVLERSI